MGMALQGNGSARRVCNLACDSSFLSRRVLPALSYATIWNHRLAGGLLFRLPFFALAFEAQDAFMEWLDECCDTICAEALDGWWTDTRSWPLDRGISRKVHSSTSWP